ncbi:hypothetical protein BJ6T_56950 [Bradyrhizobium japonicum USDA 6]|nr:hypothetical protein BJ6T_56950 [Bradyrhizobium japonicum USDA 6]
MNLGPFPGLRDIAPPDRRGRDSYACCDQKRSRGRVELFFLIDEVERSSEFLTAIIERRGADMRLPVLVVQRRVTIVIAAIDANSEFAVLAEPSADVEMRAELGVRRVVGRNPREIDIRSTLRDDIDGAPDAAVRGHPVEQRGRALDDLDPFDVVGEDTVVRCDTVDTVEGNFTDIPLADRKAADEEGVEDAAGLAGETDRRVVADDVGYRAGLLILDLLRRVTGDVERRVHEILVAQQADLASAGDLPT